MKQKKSWWILAIVSIGVMLPFMYPYLTLDPAKSRIAISSETIEYPALIMHIAFAFIALVTGFLQFINRIRRDNPKVHRIIGRIYVISVCISGLLALAVIFYVEDFTKALAFLALAILWLFTTWQAYRKAVKRRFSEHRIWMIRSFSITLVAVSARILVPILLLCYLTLNGFTLSGGREQLIEELLKVNIWAGLVLNIVIVEWMILSRKMKEL
ncbi:DUF2306 domain-containing protein [Metabacillus sediminilitoris]|uniref:DUF2306 domain-containing protein n=1 Tax=Metabacillus sediminilitoris TaxID=2567941 RepID=A0A4S4C3F1_9BACI|nr:DUF2306 domain-containing protein [Metabacillus sediminilitoris]THF81609.1 DUF2306 domain-containing protein [Metabacillus sediminilitoris]